MRKSTHQIPMTLVATMAIFAVQATASAQGPAVAQNTDRVAEAAPTTDTQNWTASGGVVVNTGNTRSYSGSLGTAFSIVRGAHGFGFESTGTFGRAAASGTDTYVTNSRNILSRARYDYFFSQRHAAFVSGAHRWDTFSGLDARVQAQVGYQYNFIRETNHRLWTEIGYDFTYDNLVQTQVASMPGVLTPADDRLTYHSVRGFVGWENQMNEHVSYKTGLEALFNVQVSQDWRLNWANTLNASISEKFQIELKFNVLYDHQPVQGFRTTDTRTTVNLVLDMW